jgi:hypothetical protein
VADDVVSKIGVFAAADIVVVASRLVLLLPLRAAAAMNAVVTGQRRLCLNCLAIRPVPER